MIMRKTIILAVLAGLAMLATPAKAQDEMQIGKQHIKLSSNLMTPEALWAMGRIGSCAASPDGEHIVYQVGYYSVKQNKSHQVLYLLDISKINPTPSDPVMLTKGNKNETDAAWLDKETIAFLCDGEDVYRRSQQGL